MKLGDVSPCDQIDLYRFGGMLTRVILRQSPADIVGSHPDDRIRRSLVIYSSSKKFDSDEPFRQALVVSRQRPFDDKIEKVPASIAARKTVACQNCREFSLDCGGLLCRKVARFGLSCREGHFLFRLRRPQE